MGHDISGCNKAGEEIAYARFSMGNYNATILYSLFNADHYYAGASGTGESSIYSVQQMEETLESYNRLYENNDSLGYDQKQILNFIQNCLATAKKEGIVKVFFG